MKKNKPLKLDWEALEDAFSSTNEELVYYVDLVDGHLLLEGEGEEDDYDDDDEDYSRSVEPAPEPKDDATHAYIHPPDDTTKIGWMREFVTEVDDLDPEIHAQLKAALAEDDPIEGVKRVLREQPDGRDRWYVYRSERVRGVIDDWVEAHNMVTLEPAPWKV